MKTIQFPNREMIESQATAWVSEIDGGMDLKQEARLTDWLSKSPLHGEIFVQAASMWDVLDVLSPIAKVMPIETLDAFETKSSKISKIKTFSMVASFGLVLIGVLLNVNIFTFGVPGSNFIIGADKIEQVNDTGQVYVTAVGERSNVTLDDGSEIKLNTDTVISVMFSKNERRIELSKGEAFFQVAKNPNRPFVVLTAGNRVTAVGTAFSIDVSDSHDTEVLVTEGRVKVDHLLRNPLEISTRFSTNGVTQLAISAPPVFLSQGQKVLLNKNRSDEITYTDDFDSALAWREGMIVFDGESLAQAIDEIDRYIPLEFKIVDKSIASIPVGGFFKTGDLDQLLLVLEGNFGVISERQGNQILLSKAP